MIKECLFCQKKIIKQSQISSKQWNQKKYCSRICRAKNVAEQFKQNKSPVWIDIKREKRCDNCKKEFIVTRPSKINQTKFCSKECFWKSRKETYKPWNLGRIEWKTCKGCGEDIRKWQIYCSFSCYNKYQEKEQIWEQNCKVCQKTFQVTKRTKKQFCCGDKCAKIQHGLSTRAENHFNWKGGITPLNNAIRTSLEYKQWRKSVFDRDNYTCQICGNKKSGDFHANHIKKFSDYIDLRFDINNGVTLCVDCHEKKVNHHETEWEDYFISIIKNLKIDKNLIV